MLVDGYDEEVVADRDRTVLRLHPQIAPIKAAILPLIAKNDDMVSKARALQDELRHRHMVEYDDGGQIGRRYRRQDEIGTPWAFTIDDQTLEDDTVTVRERDSLAQERLPIVRCARVARERARAAVELAEAVRRALVIGVGARGDRGRLRVDEDGHRDAVGDDREDGHDDEDDDASSQSASVARAAAPT